MERTPDESQHTKLTLVKKILPPLLPGFENVTFRSRVRRSNQQAIPAQKHTALFYPNAYNVEWDLMTYVYLSLFVKLSRTICIFACNRHCTFYTFHSEIIASSFLGMDSSALGFLVTSYVRMLPVKFPILLQNLAAGVRRSFLGRKDYKIALSLL